jgi:hypothetical protein
MILQILIHSLITALITVHLFTSITDTLTLNHQPLSHEIVMRYTIDDHGYFADTAGFPDFQHTLYNLTLTPGFKIHDFLFDPGRIDDFYVTCSDVAKNIHPGLYLCLVTIFIVRSLICVVIAYIESGKSKQVKLAPTVIASLLMIVSTITVLILVINPGINHWLTKINQLPCFELEIGIKSMIVIYIIAENSYFGWKMYDSFRKLDSELEYLT